MQKYLHLSLVLFFSGLGLMAQRKSDLLLQIDQLNHAVDSLNHQVAEARQSQRSSLAKADALESQVTELQDANTTLLKNLNAFAEVSNKNSEIVNNAMASLQAKEAQLQFINDIIIYNDSLRVAVVSHLQQTLGEEYPLNVSDSEVTLQMVVDEVWDSGSGKLTEKGQQLTENISMVLSVFPDIRLSISNQTDRNGALVSAAIGERLCTHTTSPQGTEHRCSLRSIWTQKEGLTFILSPDYREIYRKLVQNRNK